MARIGSLVNLQKQIPKYNHNYLSVLIDRSFYYVSVKVSKYLTLRTITIKQQTTDYMEIFATKRSTSYRFYIKDHCSLSIQYSRGEIWIMGNLNQLLRLFSYIIKDNTIQDPSHNWIDERFLTLDRSAIISLCKANI